MAILVTGGAGYIGSILVEVLCLRDAPVVVLDSLSLGHREAVPSGVPLYVGDVNDEPLLEQVFSENRIDSVFHFAAFSLVGESMKDPGAYFRNNVGGVATLLHVMSRRGVGRFILSSTAATYGDPAAVPISETAPTHPSNPYGESKLLCERMLRWFGQVHGIRWTSLRYFNAAGASLHRGEDHAVETHLIPLALKAAGGWGDPLKVYGLDYPTPDGTCIRDYIHVEDLAEAHLLALDQMEKGSDGIYNLGNGKGFSVLEVLQTIESVTGRKVPWSPASRRAGDPARLVASSQKARRELGWAPSRGKLETIVSSAWRWLEAHPHGYAAQRS